MVAPSSLIGIEEYFKLEQRSDIRHEYIDGQLLAMAGESQEHEEIVLNIVEALRSIAKAKGCRLYTKNIKLHVTQKRYRYPDVMILCTTKTEDGVETQPCFVLEVLSDSTAQTDLSEKLREYTALPSVEQYAIVSQGVKLVILYNRAKDGWKVTTLETTGNIDIPCLAATLSLEQLYEGLGL